MKRIVDLSNSRISHLPCASFFLCTHLNISNNLLVAIPFGHLLCLESLFADENLLESLDGIENCLTLTFISFKRNRLSPLLIESLALVASRFGESFANAFEGNDI